jgi:acetyltransferase-like isoleucine patch superfamily enzyme
MWKIIERLTKPVPPGLWLINVVVQRILRVNGRTPWMVHFTSRVTGHVQAGRGVWVSFALSGGCYVQAVNGVIVGDDTVFGPGVKIISANHDQQDLTKWVKCEPIRIGNRCWIGANAVILPGVSLGDGAVVGAGAVVTRSFPAYVTIAGVPARLLHTRTPAEVHDSIDAGPGSV